MNIQPLDLSERSISPSVSSNTSPNTSPTALRKEHSVRRTRRSSSIKKIDNNVNRVKRVSLSLTEPTISFNIKDIKIKHVEHIVQLRNIYECLMTIFNSTHKKIVLDKNRLEITSSKENIVLGQEVNMAVVEFIYHRILRAMTSQIYYFFDDKGYSVTLKDLDKMTQKIYGEHHSLAIEVKKELADYYDGKSIFLWEDDITNECEFNEMIRKLPFPENYNRVEVNENQKNCISIFQRMYPVRIVMNEDDNSVPVMAPITFLCSYKNMVTTTELFQQILRVIILPNSQMPYVQKLRVLNFIRVYLSSHIHEDEKLSDGTLELIKRLCMYTADSLKPEFIDLFSEIILLLEEKETYFQNGLKNECLEPNYKVEAFLSHSPSRLDNYPEFLNYLTDNLKYLGGQAVSNVRQVDLFKEKNINEDGVYYMQVVNFGVRHFIETFEAELRGTVSLKSIKRKLNTFFEFFVDIAYDLTKKHDYLSSFAFYSVLNMSELSSLLAIHLQKQNKSSFSRAKKNTILLTHTTEQKLQELQDLFLMSKNFETVRMKMKECQDARIYYIPLLAPLKNIILHKIEGIESSFPEDTQKINNEKLHMIADEMWEVNKMLQGIKKQFKNQVISIHTDIGYHLVVDEKYNEKKLETIYKKLKELLA